MYYKKHKISGVLRHTTRDITLKIDTLSFLQNDNHKQYKILGSIVLCSYLIIYFLFLIHTNFIPYVFDNNETFSNLMHAQNLYNFGFKYTFGLTDEAFAIAKEAHPFVYTHQGNFPRLYSFLLYCLNIRSAEWQIGITTFTIGLAGIAFCYHFFAKYVSPLFSIIFCLLLMSDYIMFMQWQVNTWRVWHLFFFFASFLCCHGLNSSKRKLYIIGSILNFMCLFYMEISYAAFVFLSSSVYLLLFSDSSWKKKTINLSIFSAGAFLGIGILIIQNIAYLGWDVFLQDLTYTFSARNKLTLGDSSAISQVTQFYAKYKIAFWENFNSIENIKNPVFMFKNFYRHCLTSYTPFLTIAAFITMLGSTISFLSSKLNCSQVVQNVSLFLKQNNISNNVLICIATTLFILNLVPNDYVLTALYIMITLGIGFYYLYYRLGVSNKYASYLNYIQNHKPILTITTTIIFLLTLIFLTLVFYPSSWGIKQQVIELTRPFSIISTLLLCLLVYRIVSNILEQNTDKKLAALIPLISYLILSIIIGWLFLNLNQHSPTTALPFLQERTLPILGGPSTIPLIIGAILLICAPSHNQESKSDYAPTINVFKRILSFLISTSIGFICTYFVFAGYITSGYWVRSCCFTIFAHMVLYAWLFFVLSKQTLYFVKNSFLKKSNACTPESCPTSLNQDHYIISGMACFILLLCTYSWCSLQWLYIKEFPPIDFNFVTLLKKWPLYNKTIVSNTYGAPLSFMGHTWAYLDPKFGNSTLSANDNLTTTNYTEFQRDFRYLWLADGSSNSAYLKPELFICWQNYNFEQLGQSKSTCGDVALVKSVRNRTNNTIGLTEIQHDRSGRDKWSIISLPRYDASRFRLIKETANLIIHTIAITRDITPDSDTSKINYFPKAITGVAFLFTKTLIKLEQINHAYLNIFALFNTNYQQGTTIQLIYNLPRSIKYVNKQHQIIVPEAKYAFCQRHLLEKI